MTRQQQIQQEQQRTALLSQIELKQQMRIKEREEFLREGQEYERQLQQDKAKLLRIKQLKLAELEAAGVPEKYRTQLARKRVLVSSIY